MRTYCASRPMSRAAMDGRCSEFCGLGHTRMRFAVVVHRAEDFAAALAQAAKEQQ